MTITLPTRNIVVPGETSGDDDMKQRLFFRANDIARMWGEERARATAGALDLDEAAVVALVGQDEKAVRAFARRRRLSSQHTKKLVVGTRSIMLRTVYRYIQQSKTGIYVHNPMPMPEYPDQQPKLGQIPLWVPGDGETLAELEQRIRNWWHSRLGPGAGGGRPPKAPAQSVPCPCGCGAQVALQHLLDHRSKDVHARPRTAR